MNNLNQNDLNEKVAASAKVKFSCLTSNLTMSILSFFGAVISAYLVYLHYVESASDICNISETLNCDIVNKSIYAEIFNVPVAILGLIAYLCFFVFFAALGYLKKTETKKQAQIMFVFLSAGLVFSLYLTGIEAFVLHAYCIFCLIQQCIILTMWIIYLSRTCKFLQR